MMTSGNDSKSDAIEGAVEREHEKRRGKPEMTLDLMRDFMRFEIRAGQADRAEAERDAAIARAEAAERCALDHQANCVEANRRADAAIGKLMEFARECSDCNGTGSGPVRAYGGDCYEDACDICHGKGLVPR